MVYGKNASSDAFFYAQTMTIREQCRDDRQNEGAMCEAAWSALPLFEASHSSKRKREARPFVFASWFALRTPGPLMSNPMMRQPDTSPRCNVYLESFKVDSWAEHERQHERFTKADREIEQRVLGFAL
jgi:hypothetical protein